MELSKSNKCLHSPSECYGGKMEQQLEINKYNKINHSVGVVMLHLEWCTKYRYKMFGKIKYKNLVTACIRRSASRNGIKIIAKMWRNIEINGQKIKGK